MTDILQWMYQYIQTFNISIFDIVDVTIIAVIIYRLLMLVRRSRAAQVAKAILLLLAALVLSSSTMLNLRVIHFFLSHMVEMGMLALIVVFQPEIRRFLEQLGSTTLGDMFRMELWSRPGAMGRGWGDGAGAGRWGRCGGGRRRGRR